MTAWGRSAEDDLARLRALQHEVADVMTVLTAGTRTLHERWDALDEQQRRELVAALARRSAQLRDTITPLLGWLADSLGRVVDSRQA